MWFAKKPARSGALAGFGSLEAFLRDYEELRRLMAGESEERKAEFLAKLFRWFCSKETPKQRG
jgi:hypothetical protein